MTCSDCKYSHYTGSQLLCWGQRFAPPVDKDEWCDGWKPANRDDGWIETGGVEYPNPFVSVQVYLPTQTPFPTVREGYIVDEDAIPRAWFVPSIQEEYGLEEIAYWKPMSDPPKGERQ